MFTMTVADSVEEPANVERPEGSGSGDRVRMTAEEEVRLARLWREHGDLGARERLVKANLGLVISIARRYRNAGVPMDELIAEGNLGLISAVDGFDYSCGSRLSTYAAYWIRQGISRAFASNSPRGRLKAKDRRDLGEFERAERTHYAKTGGPATDAEIAEILGWSTHRVAECRAMHQVHMRPASLDQRRADGTSPVIQPTAATEAAPAERTDTGSAIADLLKDLSPFERAAVEMRFGLHGAEPQSVDTIANSLDHTRRETREALRMAMAKLARRGRLLRMNERSFRAADEEHDGWGESFQSIE